MAISDLNLTEQNFKNNSNFMFLDDPIMYIKIHGSKKWLALGYMDKEKIWKQEVVYATFKNSIPATEIRRDPIEQTFTLESKLYQLQPDTIALLSQRNIIATGNRSRVIMGSKMKAAVFISVDIVGKTVNGQELRLRIRKGQLTAENFEMAMGGEEHTGVDFSIMAQIDETPSTTNPEWDYVTDGDPDALYDNIAFFDWQGAKPDIEVKLTGEVIDGVTTSLTAQVPIANRVSPKYCDTTNSSTTVYTNSTADMVANMRITGTGIAASTTVSSITDTTSFVISAAATATGTDVEMVVTDVNGFGSNDHPAIHVRTYTITNRGDSLLTLTGSGDAITKSGTDTSYFVIAQPSGTTIAAGLTDTFTVTYSSDGTPAVHDDCLLLIETDTENDANFYFDLEETETT